MANPTYKALVNKVLLRLRETQATTVADNDYTSLIGEFLNMTKTDIEASWTWRVNRTTISVAVLGDSSTVTYTLVGAGNQFKLISDWNTTVKVPLIMKSEAEMDQLKNVVPATTVPASQITNYCFRGVDSNGDAKIEIYPAATQAQTLVFRLYVPQADLVNDTDTLNIPFKPVVEGTYAMAIAERGEDGGLPSAIQDARAKRLLSDAIADDMALTGDDEQEATAQMPVGGGW